MKTDFYSTDVESANERIKYLEQFILDIFDEVHKMRIADEVMAKVTASSKLDLAAIWQIILRKWSKMQPKEKVKLPENEYFYAVFDLVLQGKDGTGLVGVFDKKWKAELATNTQFKCMKKILKNTSYNDGTDSVPNTK